MIDIIKLFKKTKKLLRDNEFDSSQDMFLSGYLSAMCDILREYDPYVPTEDVVFEDYESVLDEIWQHNVLLVEDERFRRAFILLCKKVEQVVKWKEE